MTDHYCCMPWAWEKDSTVLSTAAKTGETGAVDSSKITTKREDNFRRISAHDIKGDNSCRTSWVWKKCRAILQVFLKSVSWKGQSLQTKKKWGDNARHISMHDRKGSDSRCTPEGWRKARTTLQAFWKGQGYSASASENCARKRMSSTEQKNERQLYARLHARRKRGQF